MTIVGAELRAPHSQLRQKPSQVEVRYSLLAKTITLHEPVVVLFSIHNGLSSPITLTLGAQKRQFFQFSLTTPDGQVLQSSFPPAGQVDIVTFGSGTQEVAPRGDYQQRLIMNQWFAFRTVGTYIVKGQLTSGIDVAGNGSLSTQAQMISLRIGERNPQRLEKVCAELTKRVEDSSSVEEWEEPALMLSYIDDPIAVRYLAQVLSTHKGTENIIVPGLERIADDSAVEVLLSSLSDQSGEVSELARRALARMEPGISNSHLKETVRRALTSSPSD